MAYGLTKICDAETVNFIEVDVMFVFFWCFQNSVQCKVGCSIQGELNLSLLKERNTYLGRVFNLRINISLFLYIHVSLVEPLYVVIE